MRADAAAVARNRCTAMTDIGIEVEVMNEYPAAGYAADAEVVALAAALTGQHERIKVGIRQ